MRICVYDWALHSIGGGQKFDCKIAEHLSRKHKVDILSLFPINKEKLEKAYMLDFSRINNFKYLYKRSNLDPTLLHLISFRKVSKIAKEYDLFFNAEAHETVKPNAKYNIIYCHFFGLKWSKPPKNFFDIIKLIGIFLIKTILKNYAKDYNKIFCNSFYTKKWLKRIWKINAEVVYPPVDIPKKVSKNKENIILSAGRLTPDKNYEFTIEYFKEVYNSGIKNYECLICGSEPPKKYYSKLKKLSEGYPVKIILNPTQKELEQIYDKSKIFVQAKGLGIDEEKYPSLLEHFGMTPVEAMAHGCIPILLNKGGYKESVQNDKSGFLFDDKEEAIRKIKLLINNQYLLNKMSKNARKRAKKFSLERLHKDLDRMINQLNR